METIERGGVALRGFCGSLDRPRTLREILSADT